MKPKEPQSKPHDAWRTDPAALAQTVLEGMREAVRDAIAEHHRAGRPVATWRDGQVVWLYADGSVKPFRPK